MMTIMVAVNPMPVVPVIWHVIVAIVRIGSVVSVRIIAVSVTRKADSDVNLSIRTLRGNQSQSAYHQCNQKKLFHLVFPFLFVVLRRDGRSCQGLPSRLENARLPLTN